MSSLGERTKECPYCGEKPPKKGHVHCSVCDMIVAHEYILYIWEETEVNSLCSIRCMDLLSESLKRDASD
jgi:hypothetical protein